MMDKKLTHTESEKYNFGLLDFSEEDIDCEVERIMTMSEVDVDAYLEKLDIDANAEVAKIRNILDGSFIIESENIPISRMNDLINGMVTLIGKAYVKGESNKDNRYPNNFSSSVKKKSIKEYFGWKGHDELGFFSGFAFSGLSIAFSASIAIVASVVGHHNSSGYEYQEKGITTESVAGNEEKMSAVTPTKESPSMPIQSSKLAFSENKENRNINSKPVEMTNDNQPQQIFESNPTGSYTYLSDTQIRQDLVFAWNAKGSVTSDNVINTNQLLNTHGAKDGSKLNAFLFNTSIRNVSPLKKYHEAIIDDNLTLYESLKKEIDCTNFSDQLIDEMNSIVYNTGDKYKVKCDTKNNALNKLVVYNKNGSYRLIKLENGAYVSKSGHDSEKMMIKIKGTITGSLAQSLRKSSNVHGNTSMSHLLNDDDVINQISVFAKKYSDNNENLDFKKLQLGRRFEIELRIEKYGEKYGGKFRVDEFSNFRYINKEVVDVHENNHSSSLSFGIS